MRVLLDGELLNDRSPATVCEALNAASGLTNKQGRMIIEVKVDGIVWDDRKIDAEMSNMTTAGEVNLQSCNALEMVSTTFRDAAEALKMADSLQREAAELIQGDRRDAAMEPLSEAIKIWQYVEKAVLLGLEYSGGAKVNPGLEAEISDAIKHLNRHLTCIRDALQSDDPIGISDTLLYDLPEVVQQWRSMLHEMIPHEPTELNEK